MQAGDGLDGCAASHESRSWPLSSVMLPSASLIDQGLLDELTLMISPSWPAAAASGCSPTTPR
jgi:hypothetical protein